MTISTLPLDQRGHRISSHGDVRVMIFPAEYFEGGGETPEPYVMDLYECGYCGQRPEVTVTDGKARADSDCPLPDGITTVTEVCFPSGKVIITDDLRPVYDGFDDREETKGFASYNSALGQHQVIQSFAALGCAFGPVGNSCPDLYRTGPDSYVIANLGWENDDDEDDEASPPVPDGWEKLAWVCTDLWAYSIADYDAWLARGGDPSKLGWSDSVIELPPGTYRFTHHSGEAGFDGWARGTVIYAHVERIRQ